MIHGVTIGTWVVLITVERQSPNELYLFSVKIDIMFHTATRRALRGLRCPGFVAAAESLCGSSSLKAVGNFSTSHQSYVLSDASDGGKRPSSPRGRRPPRGRHLKDRYGTEQDEGKKVYKSKRIVPMSNDLLELYEAVKKGDKKALAAFKKPKETMSDREMRLLADTIELYFSMVPSSAQNTDGLRRGDRNALAALAKLIRLYKGSEERDAAIPSGIPISSPIEKKVVNAAPPGRLPYQALGVNEEIGAVYWGLDLTGGKAQEAWKNARLSDSVKNTMYQAYKENPEKYTPERLAEIFRIRQQRVLAILRLKEIADKDEQIKSDPIAQQSSTLMQNVLRCDQGIGSNEKHHVSLPSFPEYAQIRQEDVVPALEKALGKSIEDITTEDITPELSKEILGIKSLEEQEEVVAAREEANLVEEFQRKLDFNLGLIGKTISRESRRTKAPMRPKEGWSLVVTPIGKESKLKHERYIATPDGTQRKLNEDEELYMERKTPRRRRKIL